MDDKQKLLYNPAALKAAKTDEIRLLNIDVKTSYKLGEIKAWYEKEKQYLRDNYPAKEQRIKNKESRFRAAVLPKG
ncbi:MAG: hypothetical protein IJM35_08555 [Bacteroidales bacterium]|nr:hypothetical protein [Bacteroidales bacterium]